MNAQDFENEYTKLWKKINAMTPELQEIYWANWDETGRPTENGSVNRCVIAILNKNSDYGFSEFKQDMNTMFDNNQFPQETLVAYYNIYVAGAKCLGDKMIAGSSSKPKM